MLEKIKNILEFTMFNFKFTDIIDISLFSIITFYLFKFLTARPQRPIMNLILAICFLFAFAKFFDLYLLSGLLRSVFTALLVLLAVVFQRDIRRFVEQFSSNFSIARKNHSHNIQDIDITVEAISELKAKKTGALIVFSGREYLDNITSGGSSLNAEIVLSLFESLFDSRTSGHDGAMIIEKGRIRSYGVHLPLSKNIKQIKSLGTRHSAALGVSERSDAFVVIVSEERGTISCAYHGKLYYDLSPTDLKTKLEGFYALISTKKSNNLDIKGFFVKNFHLKVFSLLMAYVAWLVIVYDPGVSVRSVVMPVEFRNLSHDYVVNKVSSDEVKVTLSGPSKIMSQTSIKQTKVLLDFKDIEHGKTSFKGSDFKIDLPKSFTIHKMQPNFITADVVKYSRSFISIRPKVVGEISEHFELVKIDVYPSEVELMVPYHLDTNEMILWTEKIDLEDIDQDNYKMRVKVVLPNGVKFVNGIDEGEVEVEFTLAPQEDQLDLEISPAFP